MSKEEVRKQLRRQDQVRKRLPAIHRGSSHSAYYWLRKVREGHLPAGNTNVRKCLDSIELSLITDFGPLNAAQQVQLNLLRPLLIFWMLHPVGLDDNRKLAGDFKWCHSKIESGIKNLVQLSDNKPSDEDDYLKWRENYLQECESSSQDASSCKEKE
jgi:hypothetical protein